MKRAEKITITITIGIMFCILTATIYIQFKTISYTDISSLENMRAEELQTEISGIKTKYEEVERKIKETLEKTEEYENTLTSETEASELLQKELKQIKDLVGLTDVTGEGVIVTLEDTTNTKKINADDLLTLLNALKAAGAEAISINNQRIVYDSYVADINGTYISVNGVRLVSPYVVSAIGNTTYLESGLSQKQYGYLDIKKAEDKSVTLEKSETITIPKSNLNLKFSYVEEE